MMMKAAVLHEIGKPLAIEPWPVPEPGFGEVQIRVVACGVCHSDVHAVDGDWSPLPVLPLIPGHEVTGHVSAIGPGVSGFSVGDAVGVPWMYQSCGSCELCLAGMETICKSAEATGYTKNGGYAEYMVANAAFVARIPAGTDLYSLAPILCAGTTTYRGIKRSQVRAGQWLTVFGIGGLGHIAIQYARAMGIHVAAIDVADEKLALARRLGAEVTVNAAREDPVAEIQKRLDGTHGALVTAVAQKPFEQAIRSLKPGGTATYIGLPGGDADELRTAFSNIINWELTIRGSNVGTRQDLNEAVAFAVNGLVKAEIATAPLEAINDILAEMRQGRIVGRKVLALS